MTHEFELVDVFGTGPFSGNPLGVVHDAQGLDTETMHAITRWLNLSETCFLLPPTDTGADYRVRIFTLERELPFAGHPTLGCAHAWLAAGGTPKQSGVVQECPAGLVRVRRNAAGLAFAAPPLVREGPVDEDKVAGSPACSTSTAARSSRPVGPTTGGLDRPAAGSSAEVLALEPARHLASGSTSASSARIRPTARRSPTRSGSSSATITAPCSKIR